MRLSAVSQSRLEQVRPHVPIVLVPRMCKDPARLRSIPIPIQTFLLALLLGCAPTRSHAATLDVLHSFEVLPRIPEAGLVQTSDGSFYGTSTQGGAHNWGTVFKVHPAGELSTIFSFDSTNGSNPRTPLIRTADETLYGTTLHSIFRISPQGNFTFFDTAGVSGPSELLCAKDGNFYGVGNSGGEQQKGTIFRMTPEGEITILHSFAGPDGSRPESGLTEGADGLLYGTTPAGGTRDHGTAFRLDLSGNFTNLLSFNGFNRGFNPSGKLVLGADGKLYGTTSYGGSLGRGDIFRIDTNGILEMLVSFEPPHGAYPNGLFATTNGVFFGVTSASGDHDCGTFFRFTSSEGLTTLASFNPALGRGPRRGLIQGADGAFYGTTREGGPANLGSIFKVTPEGEISAFASFASTNGIYPSGRLAQSPDGTLYGITISGGTNDAGTVFQLSTSLKFATLASFDGKEHLNPQGGLLADPQGDFFYGVTRLGGPNRLGSIFRVSRNGEVISLATFNGTNGSYPEGSLIYGDDGFIYGMTTEGGPLSGGSVFRFNSSEEFQTLVFFQGTNGYSPKGALLEGDDGFFYGVTGFGGTASGGTVFKMSPSGNLTNLASFSSPEGDQPKVGLVAANGGFYGTTVAGGLFNNGMLFQLTTNGSLTTLHSFDSTTGSSLAPLVRSPDGTLFGSGYFGGEHLRGSIFRLLPSGQFDRLLSIEPPLGAPGEMILGLDGNLYGTTASGQLGGGTIFRLRLEPQQPRLEFTRSGSQLTLSWSAPDYRLQTASSLTAPTTWSDLPPTIPQNATILITNSTSFFRLAK